MTTLRELVEVGDRRIFTGEAPAVDAGTLASFGERIFEMARFVDAMNATDNTAAHAHASNVACAIAIAQAGVEPILQVVCRDKNRIACQADMMGAALHGVAEHLLPDGRRRHGGRRARGAARLRPRRAPADRVRDLSRIRPLPLGPQDRSRAPALRRRRREPGRAAARLPRPPRGEEDRCRSAVPPAPDLLSPGPPRGVRRRAARAGADGARCDPAGDRPRARGASSRLHGSRGPGHRRSRRDDRADRAGRRPGRGRVRAGASSRRVMRSRSPAFAGCT